MITENQSNSLSPIDCNAEGGQSLFQEGCDTWLVAITSLSIFSRRLSLIGSKLEFYK